MELDTFFKSLNNPQATDYIYFQVQGGRNEGAWCATRADWYISEYLDKASGSATSTSGAWNKWSQIGDETQNWAGPVQTAYNNYYGTWCSNAYSWCSEWGIGGQIRNGVMPGRTAGNPGEAYASGWSNGAGWTVTIRHSATRFPACGF
jgi:hypothetical protein